MPDRAFPPDALAFLRELEKNNTKAWFEANKPRFEASLLTPAVAFVAAIGPRLTKLSAHVTYNARPYGGSISRIYRDTRFSKDKRPYQTHLGMHFGHDAATKEANLPGFFFHLAPGDSGVHAGIWHPAPPHLAKIRDAIVDDPAAWKKLLGRGISIEGESLARVPPGYPADHPFASDLRRKDFYASRKLADRTVSGPGFVEAFATACRELDPLNRYLADAIGVPW